MNGEVFVVLDRDGTLIEHVPYLTRLDQVVVIPEAVDAVRILNEARIPTVVITNQPVVSKGLINRTTLDLLHLKLSETFRPRDAELGQFYVCPHQESDHCQCRKPRTQLLRRAADSLGLDPSSAFVIGDSLVDMELASNIGARGLHVQTGILKEPPEKYLSFANLLEAAQLVLSSRDSGGP